MCLSCREFCYKALGNLKADFLDLVHFGFFNFNIFGWGPHLTQTQTWKLFGA